MSWRLLAPRALLRTTIMAFMILMASLIAPVHSTPAQAAALGDCVDPVFCLLGAQLPDLKIVVKLTSVPNNYPTPSVPNNYPTAVPTATATPYPTQTSAVPTYDAMPPAMTPTATAYSAQPQPTATKTARPHRRGERLKVKVKVSVRIRPLADARIKLLLTSKSTVLAQGVVRVRANAQGLVTRSIALGYSTLKPLRATLKVRVSTAYGAVTHAAPVLLQPAPTTPPPY
jgi:hypothetical protein